MLALSTRSGIAGESVFAVGLAAFSGFFWLGLLGTGLVRGRLLSFVQAWEGEIRDLVHIALLAKSVDRSGRSALLKSLGRIQQKK
ncbi:hypothetical protein BK664_03125 [Pseudomonas brassicacearum]|jgi:hypothetical protein|uniref:Uncharacterized protein n=1 Tax=Pseudomonas brassicacearum TaxID=930166 RepID=A0A423JV89_9PSED|nr:hypothetical protein BK664_03125 [Pseudomonas brassicacearum]